MIRLPAAQVIFRSAALDDLPAILAIERRTDTAPHWPESAYHRYLPVETPGRAGPEPVRRTLSVAVIDGRLRGFAAASLLPCAGDARTGPPDTVAELESLVVEASVRRLGLGGGLCREVLGWARRAGADWVELEVRARSLGAHALYAEVGFAVTGRRRSYYRNPEDDALLFRLQL